MENQNIEIQNKKTNKKGTGVIIVLVIVILGLVGYITYDKVFANNSTSKSNSKNNSSANVIDDAQPNNYVVDNSANDAQPSEDKKEEIKQEEVKNDEPNTSQISVLDNKNYIEMVAITNSLICKDGNIDELIKAYNEKDKEFINDAAWRYLTTSTGDVRATPDGSVVPFVYTTKSTLDQYVRQAFNIEGLDEYELDVLGRTKFIKKEKDPFYKITWAGTSICSAYLKNIIISKDDNASYLTANVMVLNPDEGYFDSGKIKFTLSESQNSAGLRITKIEKIN